MSNYKTRDEYFGLITHKNLLIAHDRQIPDTDKYRKSYFRVNDMDELNAACVNWAHFPCVVHMGHDILFRQPGAGLPRKIIGNHLLFLSRIKNEERGDTTSIARQIQNAYKEAEQAMDEFLSYMKEEMDENNICGELFLFDLEKAQAEQVGPFQQVLYGWALVFYDETKATTMQYDAAKWYTD